MSPRCPYCGRDCDCERFPFKKDGQIPAKCKELVDKEKK